MLISHLSSNAILAKARAMYGKSLKAKDYANLLNCHSVSEIAAYLKNNTSYSGVLADINEATIHRGYLEVLLRRKIFNDYASIARYDMSVGLSLSNYLIQRAEIEQIMSCLRLIGAQRAGEFLFSIPMFFASHTELDLAQMSRSATYAQLLDAIKDTKYYSILAKYTPQQDGRLLITEIENALYKELTETVNRIIENFSGPAKEELKALYGTRVDTQNVTRIYRLKRYFNADAEYIKKNLLPAEGTINARAYKRMMEAADANEVMEIFRSTGIGKRVPQSQLAFTYDLHQRVPYFAARKFIHYSIHPATVLMAYIFIMDMELDDITNIIEGVRYGLLPEEIKPMLVLANY